VVTHFLLTTFLPYSSSLKMEVALSFETYMNFYVLPGVTFQKTIHSALHWYFCSFLLLGANSASRLWNCWHVKAKYWENICSSTTLSTTNTIWPDLRSNREIKDTVSNPEFRRIELKPLQGSTVRCSRHLQRPTCGNQFPASRNIKLLRDDPKG
jgi:hypothetical protein